MKELANNITMDEITKNEIHYNMVQETINLEEEFKKEDKCDNTWLQDMYENACSDVDTDFRLAHLIEANYYRGSMNNTPYIVMRYKLNESDVYYDDNFYLSEASYKHNFERLNRVVTILGGKLSKEICETGNTLADYLKTLTNKDILIQQIVNSSGYKIYNVKKIQEEVV